MWNIKDDNVHYYRPNGAAAVRCDGVHKNVNQQKSLTEKKKIYFALLSSSSSMSGFQFVQ